MSLIRFALVSLVSFTIIYDLVPRATDHGPRTLGLGGLGARGHVVCCNASWALVWPLGSSDFLRRIWQMLVGSVSHVSASAAHLGQRHGLTWKVYLEARGLEVCYVM